MAVNVYTKVDIDIDFEVDCRQCGSRLDAYFTEYNGTNYIEAEPCEECLEEARNESCD